MNIKKIYEKQLKKMENEETKYKILRVSGLSGIQAREKLGLIISRLLSLF